MKCNTKTARAKKESQLGWRYSVLLDLPYFDAPTMLAVDPMHSLFLGTGKHMINIWNEKRLLDSGKFEQMQNFVDNMTVPCDVGRIPRVKLDSVVLRPTSTRIGLFCIRFLLYLTSYPQLVSDGHACACLVKQLPFHIIAPLFLQNCIRRASARSS